MQFINMKDFQMGPPVTNVIFFHSINLKIPTLGLSPCILISSLWKFFVKNKYPWKLVWCIKHCPKGLGLRGILYRGEERAILENGPWKGTRSGFGEAWAEDNPREGMEAEPGLEGWGRPMLGRKH